ncbi:MAG: hypothetical protein ACREXR_16365, partial [Gammaproteobacteria bacterium]
HAFYGDNAAGWETALSFHPTYIPSGYFTPSAAILPRGFGFFWAGDDAHNLLQLAYNLDYSEKFIAGGKRYVSGGFNPADLDRVEGNFLSWETKTIVKDNALKRDHVTGEIVSVVAGSGVGSVQPPFTIVPHEDHGNCISTGDPASATRTVERVPFPVAIPVLTGWDLRYVCDDEPVEEVGVWIENFEYIPGGYNGSLNYTVISVLHDEDKGEDNRFRHRVALLGFDRAP